MTYNMLKLLNCFFLWCFYVNKSTFTREAKRAQTGMKFHFGWKSHFGVQPALYLRSHELRRNETQNGMDFILVILTEIKFQTGMRFSCEHFTRNEMNQRRLVSFWQKWSFISCDKICKHNPKWNVCTCPSKYRVVLKSSRNKTSCEQNLFSRRFEISNRYEFISPLMWTCS